MSNNRNPEVDLVDSSSDTASDTSSDSASSSIAPVINTPFIRTAMNGFIFITFCSAVWLLVQYSKAIKKTSFKGLRNRMSSKFKPSTFAPVAPAPAVGTT